MNLLPELPLVLRRIVSQYGLPSTKEDVEVLRDLGATDKDLITVLDADNPKRGEEILDYLLIPDKTINQKKFKLSRFLSFARLYFPTIKYLYVELREKDVDLDYDYYSLDKIRLLAHENKDPQLALDVTHYIDQKFPGYDLFRNRMKFI